MDTGNVQRETLGSNKYSATYTKTGGFSNPKATVENGDTLVVTDTAFKNKEIKAKQGSLSIISKRKDGKKFKVVFKDTDKDTASGCTIT